MAHKASDPTKDREFKRVLTNLLNTPPKPHSEMKLGKTNQKAPKKPIRRDASAKPKTA